MKKDSPKKKKLSLKARIAIGVTAVIIIGLIAIIAYLLLHKEKNNNDRPTVVTEANVDEVIAAMDEPVADGSYEITMNTEWIFNGTSSDAYVANSANNTRTVYFDVAIAGTGQLVYSSPYLPVGSQIKNFALDAKLNSGAYDGIVTYHLVDDKKEEVSNLSVTVTFQVN